MLSQDQIDRYRRDGFLHIPGVYSGLELAALRAAADRLMQEAAAYGRELDATRGPIALHDDHGFTEWGELDDRELLYGRGRHGERLLLKTNSGVLGHRHSPRNRAVGVVRAHADPSCGDGQTRRSSMSASVTASSRSVG